MANLCYSVGSMCPGLIDMCGVLLLDVLMRDGQVC